MIMPYHFLSGIYKLPPSEYKKFEETGSYIKIIPYYNNKYYTEREIIYTENFYKAYEFNLNKRGGSSGKISFNIPLDNININDKVEYFLNGTKKFVGYIESIDNSGLNVTVIPIWGRLIHQYIQGDLILESTKGVLDIVLSLREKIEEMGIIFDEKNIDLNNDKQITISFSGKNVSDILDEVEENISKSYSWGVDINNTFYFKEFSNIPTKKLNWHNNHFSESEYTEDSSDLVSRYIIKMKDSITDENGEVKEVYRALPKIVGADKLYPAIPLEKEIGIKTDIFELNYKLENYDLAYEYVYQFLTNQEKKESVQLKNINYNLTDININECVECILKPTNNFYKIIDFNDFTIIESHLNDIYSSDIIDIDSSIETRKYPNYKQQNSVKLSDIDKYYKDVCNHVYNITKIAIFFSDGLEDKESNVSALFQVEDGEHTQRKYCKNGFALFDVSGYDKRNIIITSKRSNILYEKFICFFDCGSKTVEMNVRSINYKFENNHLIVDAELSKMNVKRTNYLYDQEERRKKLESLLTYSES